MAGQSADSQQVDLTLNLDQRTIKVLNRGVDCWHGIDTGSADLD